MGFSALERMKRLVEVNAALSRTMTPDQVASVAMTVGLSAAGTPSGAILCLDDEAREYFLLEQNNGDGLRTSRLPLDSLLPIAECARRARRASGDAHEVLLPLLIRGHSIGALAVRYADGETPDDEANAFLDAMADQCAQALERARLYAIEQVRREELERSNRLKDDFLGIVSHELRTPLSAILGWARMLKRGSIGGVHARDRALDAIERNATLQARLVDDLLDVSRIVSGKLELEASAVDLAAVIEAALDSVRPSLIAKGLEMRMTLAHDGVTVLGDSRRLQQVVWNLLTNAIKFTPPRGRIELLLTRASGQARITVRDTGIGIPGDVLPHVFERFKQADESATRRHGGLGLGLSIVRHVVEAHGGQAEAFSGGRGEGAEFIVELPLTDLDSLRSIVAAEPVCGVPLEGARVLLVDDDSDTLEFLSAALMVAGAELRAVSSARAALDAMGCWRPDVIVSDIAMPQVDGYALIRAVRAMTPEAGGRTPAVALTALARPKDRTRALAAGFQTHLPKPVDPGELVLAVTSLRHAGA
jgi:signal transduction histidine kinase/CheY-like chemotaxis protein